MALSLCGNMQTYVREICIHPSLLFSSYFGHFFFSSWLPNTLFDMLVTEGTWSKFLLPPITRPLAKGPLQHTEHLPQTWDQCSPLPGAWPKLMLPALSYQPIGGGGDSAPLLVPFQRAYFLVAQLPPGISPISWVFILFCTPGAMAGALHLGALGLRSYFAPSITMETKALLPHHRS